ncbi:Hypothetical protein AA314_02106 [Archangium gephyra]|uniref:Uncharacterized protein n=1 Tax=Archangium gephyra TaxID=48 RepID=A0AAC8TC32_9BACT|nr:Hypothetical protein AA314_02106 [Archangium gephyra]
MRADTLPRAQQLQHPGERVPCHGRHAERLPTKLLRKRSVHPSGRPGAPPR